MDRRGRDQFVVRYGDETEVCWNDHQKQQAEQVRYHTTMIASDAVFMLLDAYSASTSKTNGCSR